MNSETEARILCVRTSGPTHTFKRRRTAAVQIHVRTISTPASSTVEETLQAERYRMLDVKKASPISIRILFPSLRCLTTIFQG